MKQGADFKHLEILKMDIFHVMRFKEKVEWGFCRSMYKGDKGHRGVFIH